jgi:hypothetical protein
MFWKANLVADAASELPSVWPVLIREKIEDAAHPAVFDEALAQRCGPALPDVPTSVGYMLFASSVSLVAALALATVASGPGALAIGVAMFFIAMFFAVPRIMLAQEPGSQRRPTLESFLGQGMVTYTGHFTGGAALVQMLIVPISLTAGALAIGVIVALV